MGKKSKNGNGKGNKPNMKGITIKKSEEFGEWFSQVITKGEMIEYTDVSGCYVFMPNSYYIWEQVQEYMNKQFRKEGVKNCYFPLFIPEKLLIKEAKHVEGFTPEVAWVTHSGETKLKEKLAVRPTSETIMYDTYKKWVRSHRDLPLRLNQWNNVVRWEFKNPVPFIRSREFLWQEGHSVHKTEEASRKFVIAALNIYEDTYKECYAIAGIKGKKTPSERFPGADDTYTFEVFVPSGKSLQGCTSHMLGQNFAKAFEIQFTDEDDSVKHPYQESWGFSTRTIGAMVMMHSDDKGLVLSPRVAPTQAVIVPILFDKTKKEVLKKAGEIRKSLEKAGVRIELDAREEYSPGWKYNEWEIKGVPLRIEFGPKDMEKGHAVVVRRDTGKKEFVKLGDLTKEVDKIMEAMHQDLFTASEELQKKESVTVKTFAQLKKAIADRKLVWGDWCGDESCEERITSETPSKVLCLPFVDNDCNKGTIKAKGDCCVCGKKAEHVALIARSY